MKRLQMLHQLVLVGVAAVVFVNVHNHNKHKVFQTTNFPTHGSGKKQPKIGVDTESLAVIVPPEEIQASYSFLKSRQRAYESSGYVKNFFLRGIGYLYSHQQVLLVGQHVPEAEQPAPTGAVQLHSIRFDNVFNQIQNSLSGSTNGTSTNAPSAIPSCDRLTLWVRVHGPEIFSGKAQTVWDDIENKNHCFWRFTFRATVPGNYNVDAKVLLWDAYKNPHVEVCQATRDGSGVPQSILEQYPQHAGFKGFKLYSSERSCCAACTRQKNPPCRYWSTPPDAILQPKKRDNGCELYFDKNVTNDDLPFVSRHLKPDELRKPEDLDKDMLIHGFPTEDILMSYFVGCGWSTMFSLDFPCLSGALDDKAYVMQEEIIIDLPTQKQRDQLPLCSIESELQEFDTEPSNLPHEQQAGRWVVEPWPDNSTCPTQYKIDPIFERNRVTEHDGENPHCWHREDLSLQGKWCSELNCHEIPESSKWESDFRSPEWMGVWRRYDCDYQEYTDQQLQQCIDKKHISKIKRDGHSIARMCLGEYMDTRMRNLTLFNNTEGGRTLTLATLGITHMMKHTEADIDAFLQKLPSRSKGEYYFLMGTFFAASEREPHLHAETSKRVNDKFKAKLVPKGYQYIDAYEMSASMSHQVSGQGDGLHVLGPTCKMLITKILHYLCYDVVEGSRL